MVKFIPKGYTTNHAGAMTAADDAKDKLKFIQKLERLETRIAEVEERLNYKEANGLDDSQEYVEHILLLAEHAATLEIVEQI